MVSQKNIDSSINSIDVIHQHYSVVAEGEKILQSAGSYQDFLDWVSRLASSMLFFKQHSNYKSSEKLLRRMSEISKRVILDCERRFIDILNSVCHISLDRKTWDPKAELVSSEVVPSLGLLAACLERLGTTRFRIILRENRTLALKNAMQNIKPEWSSLSDDRASRYSSGTHLLIFFASSFVRLLEIEKQFSASIICQFTLTSPNDFDFYFDEFVDEILEFFIHKIDETLKQRLRNKMLIVFDLVAHLQSLKPMFRAVLPMPPHRLPDEDDTAGHMGRVVDLLHNLISIGRKAVDEYRDSILQHPAKQPASNGTIHTLTVEVLSQLKALCDYRNTVEASLLSSQIELSHYHAPTVMGALLLYVIEGLEINLKAKSKSFPPIVASLFLMNNFHYILSNMSRELTFKLIGNEFVVHYEQLVAHARQHYREASWDKILAIIDLSDESNPQKIEKGAIKRKFTEFNSLFFELYSNQRLLTIPDSDLRSQLRNDNVTLIAGKYAHFLAKYSEVNFSKSKNKYIKYPLTVLESMLNRFFEEEEL